MRGSLPKCVLLSCVALIFIFGVSGRMHAQDRAVWKQKLDQADKWLSQRELDSARVGYEWVLAEARAEQDICWQSRALYRLSD